MEEGNSLSNTGFWTEDSLAAKIREVASSLGHFPTGADLRILGLRSAEKQIYKHNGGMNAYREKLGFSKLTEEQHHKSLKKFIKHNQGLSLKVQEMEVGRYDAATSLKEPTDLGYSPLSFLETFEGGNREDD